MDVIGSSFQMVRIRRRFWINHSSSSRSRSTHVFAHGPEMDPRPISFLHLSLRSPLAASTSVDAMAFASASPLSANPFKPLYPSPPRPSPRFAATQIVCQTSGESSAAFLLYRILSSTWCARLLDRPRLSAEPKKWRAVVSTALAVAVVGFSGVASADLNKFEAEIRGEFGIGSAAQFGSADLK